MRRKQPSTSRAAIVPREDTRMSSLDSSKFEAPAGDLFRAVADYTYDWESWHGVRGELIWCNPAVERMTGFTVAECLVMAEYPLPIVHPDDRLLVSCALEDGRRGVTGENVEFRVPHREREELRWMSLCWQPMYGAGGEYRGFRTSIRDITERQQLREQLRTYAVELEQLVEQRTTRLRQLERRSRQMEKLAALGQLAAGVAHEINNPLAGIRNAFELIRSGLSPAHRHYDLLELIDREIERISGIVHQMYQLYRRQPQPTTEFALERTTQDVVYLLETAAEKQRVSLRFDPPESPVAVQLPEGEVKQILYNLTRNAIQASPVGGDVLISIDTDVQEVTVRVKDSGPGISDELLPHIFDPFFSTKHDQPQSGMGLGLSVSRSLIDAMGGRIDVDSRQGAGSTFAAVFPRHLEPLREAADA